MKRTLLQRGAIIAACAAAFVFAACGDDPEFDARTDTVYSLETPSVTAKAYPGVNVVSWKPVTGAQGYNIFIYEEGVYKNARLSVSGNFYSDTNLVNSKTYTYYVEAVSKSDPAATSAREVFVKNSRGEASVRAIVPPYGTESLDLAAYEGGYDGKTVKTVPENEKFSATDITVADKDNGFVYVSFPMKAYLNYTVNYYDNNLNSLESDSNIDPVESIRVIPDLNANNALGQVAFPITSAGTYQIAVVAFANNRNYVTSKEVPYGTITIKQLELDTKNNVATEEASVGYLYNDNKIANNTVVSGARDVARVSFKPATKDDVNVLTSWYKVYRRVDGEYTNTLLAAVKEDVQRGVYYVDDKVPDITKTYRYTIVVTDGKSYGKAVVDDSNNSKLNLKLSRPSENKISDISISDPSNDNTKKESTWTITPSDNADNASVKLTAYYWVKPADWNTKVLADDIIADNKTVALTGVEDSANFTTKTTVEGNVYLLVKAEREGYTTTYFIKNGGNVRFTD